MVSHFWRMDEVELTTDLETDTKEPVILTWLYLV